MTYRDSELPPCWRCKRGTGIVYDGTSYSCPECAGNMMRETRDMLEAISLAVREGLDAWPRIMDRVEFVRECIKLHRLHAEARAR